MSPHALYPELMTDPTPTSVPIPKPYVAPTLTDLGTIGAITTGPNDGTLDQLGGASGGFLVAHGTS